MQIFSQLSRFMNLNNDHCDLGFSLTVCDILGWPYRGHEAASGEFPGHVVWRGKIQLKCGDSGKLLTWLLWGMPRSKGRALIAYLIGRGLAPLLLT
jgi:hypothetical protein